nr:hypothetical protein [Tanacetum cinerariifolium]
WRTQASNRGCMVLERPRNDLHGQQGRSAVHVEVHAAIRCARGCGRGRRRQPAMGHCRATLLQPEQRPRHMR